MMNSFCTDEVSASLARCGRVKSDGEILVNDELRGDTSFSLRLLWIISCAYSCIMRSMHKRRASPAVAMSIFAALKESWTFTLLADYYSCLVHSSLADLTMESFRAASSFPFSK